MHVTCAKTPQINYFSEGVDLHGGEVEVFSELELNILREKLYTRM